MASLPAPRTIPQAQIFADLDAQHVDMLLRAATPQHVNAKQQIFLMGQPAMDFFVLRSGRARYYCLADTGEEITHYLLTSGDALGFAALLREKGTYGANAVAIADCELLVWRKATIRTLAASLPQLVENSLRIVLTYLKSSVERHVNLITKTAEQRLALALLDLAERSGRVRPHGVEIEATNEQLGSLADIGLFTTSRLLKSFERAGTLSKTRGKVLIREPEDLAVA